MTDTIVHDKGVGPATGTLPHSSYGDLPGFMAKPMAMPMERSFVLCVGPPGEGKTSFVQSCPTGFTFNLDKSSTSPHVKGMVWPGVDSKGQFCDKTGKIIMSWEAVLAVQQQIVSRATDNKSVPTTVFIDSLSALIPLIMDYMVRQNDVEYWQDLDGRRMYGIMYDRIVRFCNDFLNVGIGVWLMGHVVNAKIQIGDDKFTIRPELTIGDGLWKRIEWALEMICGIERVTKTILIKQPTPEGRKSPPPDKKEEVTKYMFITGAGEGRYGELMKQRVPLPGEIEVPYEGGWAVVAVAYKKATQGATD